MICPKVCAFTSLTVCMHAYFKSCSSLIRLPLDPAELHKRDFRCVEKPELFLLNQWSFVLFMITAFMPESIRPYHDLFRNVYLWLSNDCSDGGQASTGAFERQCCKGLCNKTFTDFPIPNIKFLNTILMLVIWLSCTKSTIVTLLICLLF